MGFFDRPKRHSFDDDDREYSKSKRDLRMKYDLMDLEQAQAEHNLRMKQIELDLQKVAQDGEPKDGGLFGGGGMDQMLMLLMMKAMGGNVPTMAPATSAQAPIQPQVQQVQASSLELSDEQLREYWDSLNVFKKRAAKKMNDEQIAVLLKNQMPGIGDDTIVRALKIVRE